MVNDGNPTYIYCDDGALTFSGETLATKQQYELADLCVGSIFEALHPGEPVKLEEGYFILDDELDLIEDWSIV